MRGNGGRTWWLGLALGLAMGVSGAQAQSAFPLKDGDTWVMIGDSITAQHLHSNYVEAFCYARFPKLTFCFRNSGVGGDTIPKVLARFDWDAAAWAPTVVSVELGMNDQNGFTTAQFVENMGTLLGRIRALQARPVLFSSSPVNNGAFAPKQDGASRLRDYALALQALAAKEAIPYANQFGALVDVWAANKPSENLARSIGDLRSLVTAQPNLVGAEHLKAFLEVWGKEAKQPVSLMGDPVHPGPSGQLTMAAALLAELKAPGLVSRAVIDGAAGTVSEAVQCKVENVKLTGAALSFDRTDEALPFPIPDDARPVLAIMDTVANLSQYMLTVTGLKAERYEVAIDGVLCAKVTAADLAKGWNLGTLDKGPVADQCRTILQLVAAKEGIVGNWRGVSRAAAGGDPAQKQQLATLTGQVKDADAKIRAAAQPKLHHVVLTPAT
jgi:lysophospholipase L1-like esterase